MKILSIVGTRPEAVKMSPVILRLNQTQGIDNIVCITSQHREMLPPIFNLFKIIPDIDLDLMRPDQSLAGLTAALFTHLDSVLKSVKPDWVLAQGDTTTVMTASIMAYYHRVRFGHVEAGLRTGDKWQPFPEEVNRMVAGVIADLHFAPTEWSRNNLLKENVPSERIIVTGNPVIDALQMVAALPLPPEILSLFAGIGLDAAAGEKLPRIVVVTAHRRENFGMPLQQICQALRELAEMFGEHIRIVYPVHPNPNVQEPVYRLLTNTPNITLLPPLDYLPMVHLMKRAALVLTDSGGLQEEAPGLGVPVLVMRNCTERPEGIRAGTVRLVGTDPVRIVSEASRLLNDPQAHRAMAQAVNPYGDGRASERIVQALLSAC